MSRNQAEGQLYTLGLLEQLRAECKSLWGASSEAYFRVDEMLRELANPNLHDIPRTSLFASSCGTAATSTRAAITSMICSRKRILRGANWGRASRTVGTV